MVSLFADVLFLFHSASVHLSVSLAIPLSVMYLFLDRFCWNSYWRFYV